MSKLRGGIATAWRRLVNLFKYIFVICPYEPFEGIWSFLFMAFALSILNPWVSSYSTGHSYDALKNWLPEDVFGSVLLFIGLNSLFALFNGNLRYRKWATLGVAILWTFLSVSFTLGNSIGVLSKFFILFSLVSINTYARIVRDCKKHSPVWTERL